MIKFNLKCEQGHGFDSWFGSNEDYEKLHGRGLVSCVICGSCKVSKAVMAPRVKAESTAPDLREKPLLDDVGSNFAEEARKIHYGETPERPIMGQAKIEEARALLEEGVPVLPMGIKPKQVN
ncbi:MAG: DUF1178 family protein [Rhodobacteraceae bacterium]|nr:DUF1178 family protein [Paracoccaceae bacterium]